MNDADVSKQIQQMVRFIRQEAEEKANEISVSAEEVLFFLFLLFYFCASLSENPFNASMYNCVLFVHSIVVALRLIVILLRKEPVCKL